MKVIYIAIDGTQFGREEDCYEYERRIHTVSDLVPDLVMKCKYAPIKIHLNRFVNENGYLLEEKYCRYENFIIRNENDIISIKKALRDLGYFELASEMTDLKSPIENFPEVLSLVSVQQNNGGYRYSKFSFINKEFRDIENYKSKIDNEVKEKLGDEFDKYNDDYYADADDGIDN